MNTELFVNTNYILNFATACYRLPYLAIVHMNYCQDFSTCLYYELTDYKRSAKSYTINNRCVKRIRNTNLCYPNIKILTNIQTNQIFVTAPDVCMHLHTNWISTQYSSTCCRNFQGVSNKWNFVDAFRNLVLKFEIRLWNLKFTLKCEIRNLIKTDYET